MTEKQPVWKYGMLWVWSDYYKRYVANYVLPLHRIMCSGMTVEEWKKMMGLDKYKVIE